MHVDDILLGGEEEFQLEMVRLLKLRFRVSKDQIGKFVYTGMSIKSTKGMIYINQNQYSQELQQIPKEAEEGKDDQKKTTLRGAVSKLLYLNLTRPDLSYRTNLLSRIPAGTDLNEKIKDARELIEDA